MALVFRRTPDQRAALNRLLEDLQDPSSSNYHRWLTPEEFGERFGPSTGILGRVADWLRAEGFTVESTARGRGWIVFSGTVAQVQNTFRTEIHRYQAGAKEHFAPAASASVPAEFEPILSGMRGLDDFYLERPTHLVPMFTASDGTHALAPGDLAWIYDFFVGYQKGQGQSIAVVGESALDLADIGKFRSTFQLPPNDPQTILAGDDPGIVRGGPLQEADADVEWAGAVARDATIIYVYATDVIVASQNVIDQNLAPILAFSFGHCEPEISQTDATFIRDLAQQANAQGITWVAASGDAGAASCDQGSYPATHGLAVSFPASLPEVTAVGGTKFSEQDYGWLPRNSSDLSSAFGYLPEVAWNDTSKSSGLRASGGGASVLYPKPSWQVGQGVPDDGARDVPDVALTASPTHDPYIVISGGKTYAAGGTSLSAPVFASMLALAESAQSVNVGAFSSFGNINPSLYALAGQPLANQVFHDITSGDNLVSCSIGTPDCVNGLLGYSAGPGYDLVTGLGSVDARALGALLQLVTTTTLSVSGTQVPEGAPVKLTATVRDYNGIGPAGSVGFIDGGSLIAIGSQTAFSLDASGTASATVLLRQGTHSITAAYSPTSDSRFARSISASVTVVVVPAAPPSPVPVSPANNATDISVATQLSWNNPGSPVSFPTYDVYFGTNPSPPFWGHVAVPPCWPGSLAPNTKYYWRVVASNELGSTTSPVWSFTTTGNFYTISTIAGGSDPGFSADGVPAAKALLSGPSDVALDRSGNFYIAEAGNNRIRMINFAAGILSTVAGGGAGGDGGPATAAQLSNPVGIAIDLQGNLYISESKFQGPSRIRKVSSDGIITTIAGGATTGYSGDGGPAVGAQLSNPRGLAVDSTGNLYIADAGNNCIREISGGMISTFAGRCALAAPYYDGDGGAATSASLSPTGVAVDAAGNVYIADTGNCGIRKVANGTITTVAGLAGGRAVCVFPPDVEPIRLVADSTGALYFTDGWKGGVVKLANGVLSTLAGGGPMLPGNGGPGVPATSALIGGLQGLAVDSAGRVYFSESYESNRNAPAPGSQRIRLLSPANAYTPPLPSITGVWNGATFAPGPVAPGSIATVFGSFGFSSPAQASGAPLPTALTGLSIQFQSGVNAPLFYASSGQVNVQMPWELAGQSSVPIRAVLNGSAGSSQTLQLAPFAPGIFTAGLPNSSQGAIVDSSNRLVDSGNPATAGSLIQIYCTGLGPVTNSPTSGSAAPGTTLSATLTKPTVTIGGIPATVLFSGLAPGTVGEYQVNVQVPAGLAGVAPSGFLVPVVLSIGGVNSNTVTFPVR